MIHASLTILAALFLGFVATPALAEDAGKVVSLEGTVEIGRAGAFARADIGSAVRSGDTVRTGNPGRARILFADDSVLNLADGTTLVIDESVFDPNKGSASTLMHLLGGKVRALVSDYYSGGRGTYQIETPTAVSGVRGTEFVMTYDAGRQMSEVLGLGGTVAVHGQIDRKNHGVLIKAGYITEIAKGKYPTPPRLLEEDDDYYLQVMDGLDLPGAGLPETLLLDDPAFGGDEVPNPDTADGSVFDTPAGGASGEGPFEDPNGTNTPLADIPPSYPGHTGGDLLGQPQPALDSSTEIDVRF
jgi:hypothetical protein